MGKLRVSSIDVRSRHLVAADNVDLIQLVPLWPT